MVRSFHGVSEKPTPSWHWALLKSLIVVTDQPLSPSPGCRAIHLSLWDNGVLKYNVCIDFNWWITVAVLQKSRPLAGIGRYQNFYRPAVDLPPGSAVILPTLLFKWSVGVAVHLVPLS